MVKVLGSICLIAALWAPRLGLAGETTYVCQETVNLAVNYDHEVRNYKLGTIIIHIYENDNVMINSPRGTGSQLLIPYNHDTSGLRARGEYCSIHIQLDEMPKQFVCHYGAIVGVTIQNVRCEKL